MGLLQRLGLLPKTSLPPADDMLAGPILDHIQHDMPIDQIWREQPHLRTVTSFIARSISSVNLHVYERDADGGRVRQRGTALSRTMFKANRSQTMQQLLDASIMDLCLYDEFIWFVDKSSGEILPISPTWVQRFTWHDPWTLKAVYINDTKSGNIVELPAEQVIRVHGYSPGSYRRGVSPVTALQDVLREQLEAAAYRGALWKKGPRISGVIERPPGIPWDSRDRLRFKQAWVSQYAGRGSGTGGTPILEDGMTFKPFHLKASDEQYVDVAKLSLSTVASVYHVNPTMVGLLDNANYSNVREFRKSLYGDSLAPVIKQIENALNAFYLPMLGVDSDRVYIEFNLDEKLRGSFEEKAELLTRAVGGPWMTRNEARAAENLPTVEGGDELIVPLNTVQGEAAAPADEDVGEVAS